ncbi:hypothetical protein G7Y89_g1347 [Cudoniella acicularis]|uniref:ABM domain-containing protein n=1 Tax=Cudoniella acicularis TaxID=354080 RepID=A0A8H4RVH4_9HELO|nr:hypothetical protein G7Y89_g1347 [Cudoniella acicularis]
MAQTSRPPRTAVLEITLLRIKNKLTPKETLPILQNVRQHLREGVHATHSRFYTCIEDISLIYIFGTWPSTQIHHDFLSSSKREEVLGNQEDIFDFEWGIHVPMPLNFGEFGGMNEEVLPLTAPVIAFARFFIKPEEEHVDAYEATLNKYRYLIEEETAPSKVFDAWRMDCKDGEKESVMLSGWRSKEHHDEWRVKTRSENEEYRGIRDHYARIEVRHLVDLERGVGGLRET